MLAGASMGAHTAVRFALAHPERVAACARSPPAFDPHPSRAARVDGWDALAAGCARAGWRASWPPTTSASCPRRCRPTSRRSCASAWRARAPAGRRRRARSRAALAPLRGLARARTRSRCRPSSSASRDEADPGHPLAVGERYARGDPRREAHRRGRSGPASSRSPIAWQGGQLSTRDRRARARALGGERRTAGVERP